MCDSEPVCRRLLLLTYVIALILLAVSVLRILLSGKDRMERLVGVQFLVWGFLFVLLCVLFISSELAGGMPAAFSNEKEGYYVTQRGMHFRVHRSTFYALAVGFRFLETAGIAWAIESPIALFLLSFTNGGRAVLRRICERSRK